MRELNYRAENNIRSRAVNLRDINMQLRGYGTAHPDVLSMLMRTLLNNPNNPAFDNAIYKINTGQ
jgi:hypothetical protein